MITESAEDLPCADAHSSLSFAINPSHFARQLYLEKERPALAALAENCQDYLRSACERSVSAATAPGRLLEMLRPRYVPVERSFVMGIWEQSDPFSSAAASLQGILYFLHPPTGAATWYLTLLLLRPAARGRGLGAATHRAFTGWAAARGSRRLVVAVARNNPRALHFWCTRLGYAEAPHLPRVSCLTKPSHRNYERHLVPATGWGRSPAF